jgi:glycosyltransferase involved in cell wall biosynthesis
VECHGQEGATAEETIRALAVRDTQAVYLHRLGTAAAYGGLARQYAPTARIIFSIADLHHLRLARQAEVTGRPDLAAQARAVKATEIWAMQLANCVITHSRFEADYLRREIPRVNVDIVPWAVPVSAPPHSRRNRAHIAFIGGAGHAPNLDAVTHLARDIMPLVWRRAPEMKCLVIGDGWPVNLFETFDPRMVSLGHQPDLGPLLASVRLTVAPLRFGAGVKGKVLVSMAAGTPCVMSTVAAEGLPLDAHLRALTGDGDALVDNILALYRDKKLNRVAVQSGLDMIQTSFTRDEVDDALARVLGIAQPGKLAESSKATAALHPV